MNGISSVDFSSSVNKYYDGKNKSEASSNNTFSSQVDSQIDSMTATLIKDKDSDGDKVLSSEELNMDSDTFSQVDTNKDGKADRAELNAFFPVNQIDFMSSRVISDKDSDGDKALSALELNADSETFGKIDTNGDGKADRAELNAYWQTMNNANQTASDVNPTTEATINVKV